MFLYLGVSGCPLCSYTPVHLYAPLYICTPPGVYTPSHMFPILLCASVCSQRLLHIVGGCKGLPYVLGHFPYTTPVWSASPLVAPPTLSWLPCALVSFGDICMSCMHFPLLLGYGGVPPLFGGSGGTSALVMPICSFLYIFVVHYVSCFYYGYDYYSSSYGGIFWPVISLISDSGSFPHRVSSKLGSVWSASTTTLMPRGSRGVTGSVSVPQQQTPSSMPLLAYANYAMGSPQVGFFSELSLPPFCILYVWCPFWCLLFTFRCQVGCHIHLWGLNH